LRYVEVIGESVGRYVIETLYVGGDPPCITDRIFDVHTDQLAIASRKFNILISHRMPAGGAGQ
jgi:hypothetical protein